MHICNYLNALTRATEVSCPQRRFLSPALLCDNSNIIRAIQQVGDLFESFSLMWQEARTCIDTIEFSKAIVWKDLIPEGFEDTALELMSKVQHGK